jgi:hypothetical protein
MQTHLQTNNTFILKHPLHLDLVGGILPSGPSRVVLAAVLVPDAAVHMGARCTFRLPCK